MSAIYQLYIDKFFLINFTCILCMLEVTKSILKCTVTHFRILKGAFMGAILFCLVVVIPNVWVIIKIIVGFFLITAFVFWYTFRIRDWKRLVRFLTALYLTVIIIGGLGYLYCGLHRRWARRHRGDLVAVKSERQLALCGVEDWRDCC